jgi:hypothetical protein
MQALAMARDTRSLAVAEPAIQQAEARALLWSQEMARAAPLAKAQGGNSGTGKGGRGAAGKGAGAGSGRGSGTGSGAGSGSGTGSFPWITIQGGEDATAENTNPPKFTIEQQAPYGMTVVSTAAAVAAWKILASFMMSLETWFIETTHWSLRDRRPAASFRSSF